MELTPELLAGLAGILLSLAFSYIPGLDKWYDALTPTPKRLIMLACLFLAALGLLVYKCRADQVCYGVEWEDYLAAFIAALVANQATASITPLSAPRRALRANAAKRTVEEPKKD